MRSFQAAAAIFCLCCLPNLFGQKKETLDENDPAGKFEDKHVLGVLPNYRTAEATADYHPISDRFKMHIALKDSFDAPLYLLGAAYAGLYQLEDSHPQFGQGMAGYARRFGTSTADQVIGNMLTEGFMPILTKEDPRYFRLAEGSVGKRTFYALSRIFVVTTDSGHKTFNFSEIGGNGIGAAIGLSYYADDRNFQDYGENWAIACATDAVSQVLKEFWPDIKRKYWHRRKADTTPIAASAPTSTNNTTSK